MRLNKKQSEPIDKSKKEIMEEFVDSRGLANETEEQLLSDVNKWREEIEHRLINLLGIRQIDFLRRNLPGYSGPNIDEQKYQSVLEAADQLKSAALVLGMFIERREDFCRLQELWKTGTISKENYLIQHLAERRTGFSRKSVREATERIDLHFGIGDDEKIEFGKGITETTKRHYRSSLIARMKNRKMKRCKDTS